MSGVGHILAGELVSTSDTAADTPPVAQVLRVPVAEVGTAVVGSMTELALRNNCRRRGC